MEILKATLTALAWLGLAAGPIGCSSVEDDPEPVYRTKELLDLQYGAPARAAAPMSGREAAKILENYHKSIGKGGAGASLPPPVGQ